MGARLMKLLQLRPPEPDGQCSFSLAASSKPATVAQYRCIRPRGHFPASPHCDQHGNETDSDQPMFYTK